MFRPDHHIFLTVAKVEHDVIRHRAHLADAVKGCEGMSESRPAHLCAAGTVREQEAPATHIDPMIPDETIATAAGADDHDAAVTGSRMGAQTGDVGIILEAKGCERM